MTMHNIFNSLTSEEQRQLLALLSKLGLALTHHGQQVCRQPEVNQHTEPSTAILPTSRNGRYTHYDARRLANYAGGCGARQLTRRYQSLTSSTSRRHISCGCQRD